MRQMFRVAEVWRTVAEGGNYDPTDIDTAPTNAQIERLLEQNGVTAKTTREVMATILRPALPPGRRPSTPIATTDGIGPGIPPVKGRT